MLRLLDNICGIVDMGFNIFFVVILCLEVPSWLQGPLLLGIFASVFLVLETRLNYLLPSEFSFDNSCCLVDSW